MSVSTMENAQTKEAGRAPLPLTSRHDTWWVKPLITAVVLGAFVIYSTFRAFENQFFQSGPYLSPFYSPLLGINISIFGWTISPALYILIFPLSFRLTCYYYRLAYYRAFFWDPPACAIREPYKRKKYSGERYFPFVLQNIHRYSFYAAAIFIVILSWDAIVGFFFSDGFHVGLGSLILIVNVVLLAIYTFSCHSFRHLIGGRLNCYSCSAMDKTRYGLWKKVSFLNSRHALLAWASLIAVGLTDVYITLLARGVITDIRFF
jgi:hypothetical protein